MTFLPSIHEIGKSGHTRVEIVVSYPPDEKWDNLPTCNSKEIGSRGTLKFELEWLMPQSLKIVGPSNFLNCQNKSELLISEACSSKLLSAQEETILNSNLL